jgi:hypothetical protein
MVCGGKPTKLGKISDAVLGFAVYHRVTRFLMRKPAGHIPEKNFYLVTFSTPTQSEQGEGY